MTPRSISPAIQPQLFPSAGAFDRLARRLVFWLLKKLKHGRLTLVEHGERYSFGEPPGQAAVQAAITVHHLGFYSSVIRGGSRGLGESYIEGWWSADDLTAVIRVLARNLYLLEKAGKTWLGVAEPFYQTMKRPFQNTLWGSRQNIAAHYDLGNEFYALFLDETMTYSCGIFEGEDSTLKDAATSKYDRICQKLALQPGDEVLEIGSGWGGFAIHAASRYGCRVTTTTISRAQYDLARSRIEAAGLKDKVRVLFQDYRHLEGAYDKLVSIEMIEAVGYEYLDTFFRVCHDRLKDDGLMCLQAITIADQVFDRYRRSYDFIRSQVFPGSCLTSVAAMAASLARATDLRLIHLEDITRHYVITLRLWRERFRANLERVRALGFDDRFIRLWEFYLCYCEGGFAERSIGDVQMLLAKPLYREAPSPSTTLPAEG